MVTRPCSVITFVSLLVGALAFAACSREGSKISSGNASAYRQVALEFTNSLAAREYPKAYAMTSEEYRKRHTVDQLRTGFDAIVPTDWGAMGPIEVAHTMTSWSGKQPSDFGWAYVSIGGNICGEAIIVVVTSENGEPKIREVEFGRP